MADVRTQVLSIIEHEWQTRYAEPLPAIREDDNLFDRGVVDSLIMMQIVTVVEKATGAPIDFLTVDPEAFFTLSGIVAFTATAEAEARRR